MGHLRIIQAVFLSGGVIFAWSTLAMQTSAFIATYGTLFRFSNTVAPNPLITACFYGSLGMLVACAWAFYLIRNPTFHSQRYFTYFVYFCVAFAYTVIGYEFLAYYHLLPFQVNAVVCTPGVFPLQTPCFFGSLFFLATAIVATIVHRNTQNTTHP